MRAPITATWKINPDVLKVNLEKEGSGVFAAKALTTTDDTVFNPGGPGRGWIYGGYGGLTTAGGARFYEGAGWIKGRSASTVGTVAYLSGIDSIEYSTSVVYGSGKNLTGSRGQASASGNSLAAWIYGGLLSATYLSTVVNVTYVTTTAASTAKTLTLPRSASTALGDSQQGFVLNGVQANSTVITQIDHLEYSTSNIQNYGKQSPIARVYPAASGIPPKGFIFGGLVGTLYVSSIDSFTYATGAFLSLSSGMVVGRYREAASGTLEACWIYAGASSSSAKLATIEKFNYDTTLASLLGTILPSVREGLAASGNVLSGWVYGGFGSTHISSVHRIDYATGNVMTMGKDLSMTRYLPVASGDSTPGEQAA